MNGPILFPDMPRQYELIRDVPDHELLLTFRDDDHCQIFREWLETDGWESFISWRQSEVSS